MGFDITRADIDTVAYRSDVYFLDKISAAVLAELPGQEKRLARLLGLLSDQIVDKLAAKIEAAVASAFADVKRNESLDPDPSFDAPALVLHVSGLTPTMQLTYMTPTWAPAGWLPAWWTEHGVEYAHRKAEPTMFAFPSSETWRVYASALLGAHLTFLQYGDPVIKHGDEASRQDYWRSVIDQIAEQIAGAARYRAGWITLSWGADGVMVHNTSRSDSTHAGFREWLNKHHFKWSRKLDAWFLPQSVGMIPPRVSIGAMLSSLPLGYKKDVGLETAYADSATVNERRREHMLDRADLAASRSANHGSAAAAAWSKSSAIGERIPFGQPILVGHHSEKRARSDQDKMLSAMRKSVEEQKVAQAFASKAASIARAAARVGEGTPEDRRRTQSAAIKASGAFAVGDFVYEPHHYETDGWIVKIGTRSATVITAKGRQVNISLLRLAKHDNQKAMPVPEHNFQLFDVVDVRLITGWRGPYTIKRIQHNGLSFLLDGGVSAMDDLKRIKGSSSVAWSDVRIAQG